MENIKVRKQTLLVDKNTLSNEWRIIDNEVVKKIWDELEYGGEGNQIYLTMKDVAEALIHIPYGITFIFCDMISVDNRGKDIIQTLFVTTVPNERLKHVGGVNIGVSLLFLLSSVVNLDNYRIVLSEKMVNEKGIIYMISLINKSLSTISTSFYNSVMRH